jgi:hypothetical protein
MGEASGEAVAMARRNGGTLGSINASELRDVLTRKGAVLD